MAVVGFALLAIWLLFLCRAIYVLGPDGDHTYFNSDGAIPVLMSNDQRPITVFDTYYYATDRWGGWPMILTRKFQHATGFHWSAFSLHAARAAWLFLGLWILVLLNRRAAIPVMLVGVISICFNSLLRLRLFDLGQVYAWQITPLLLGWYGLRKWFEQSGNVSGNMRAVLIKAAWSLFVCFFCFLAIWSSPASWPVLCFLVLLEGVRSHLRKKWEGTTADHLRRWLRVFRLVVVAIFAEVFLRINYHRYSLKHFQRDFKTNIALDVGYLWSNLRVQIQRFLGFSWWPLIVLALLTVVVLIGIFVFTLLKKRSDMLRRFRELTHDDAWTAIVGCVGIASIHFALTTLVNHVRINHYHNRFLTLTFFFGSISGLLLIFVMVRWLLERFKILRYAPAVLVAIILLMTITFPPKRDSAHHRALKETATALIDRSPDAALMGGYWDTYVFAALQPVERMLMPLPVEHQTVRMPWTKRMLGDKEQVVMEYRHSKPGDYGSPPQHLMQYGNSLRLVEANWYQNGEYVFALYHNEGRRRGARAMP